MRICKSSYAVIVAFSPEEAPRMHQSPFFYVPLVLIALGVVGIGMGW